MALRLNLAWGGGERRCLASLPMAPGLSSFCLGAPHPKVLPSAILHMSISPQTSGLGSGDGMTPSAPGRLLGFASRCSCEVHPQAAAGEGWPGWLQG